MSPRLEKFRHFGIFFKVLGNFLTALFSVLLNFDPTLANVYGLNQFSNIEKSQKYKNNLTVWSHWTAASYDGQLRILAT